MMLFRGRIYSQVCKTSSNNARDKKMTDDIFQLGLEPSVDNYKPTYSTLILTPLQMFRKKTHASEQESLPKVSPRKCPDPNLYEDLLELEQCRVVSPDLTR